MASGTLCVFDVKPRHFEPAQYAMLAHFAELVVWEMELELNLQQQQVEMRMALSAETHLMRAIDAFQGASGKLEAAFRLGCAVALFRRLPRLNIGCCTDGCMPSHYILSPLSPCCCRGHCAAGSVVDFMAHPLLK